MRFGLGFGEEMHGAPWRGQATNEKAALAAQAACSLRAE
jgi:hypothetical protein